MNFTWDSFISECIGLARDINYNNSDTKSKELINCINKIPENNPCYDRIKKILLNHAQIYCTIKEDFSPYKSKTGEFYTYLKFVFNTFKTILTTTIDLSQIQHPVFFYKDMNKQEKVKLIKKLKDIHSNMFSILCYE